VPEIFNFWDFLWLVMTS